MEPSATPEVTPWCARRAHLNALLSYVAVALVGSWPLPLQLSTHLIGDPSGDTGVYAWNLWHFRDRVLHGLDPFRSSALFVPTGEIDLGLHNYTVFLDLVALPLLPWLGLPATYNLLYLLLCVLNGWAMFALAGRVSRSVPAAWLAGVAFALSPFLTARSTAHLSLVAATPLPVFLLLLLRLEEKARVRDAVLLGLTLAWALYCDPYYAVFCVLLAAASSLHAVVSVTSVPRPSRLARGLGVLAVVALAVGLGIGLTGGAELRVAGIRVMLKSPSTPMLIVALAIALRLAVGRSWTWTVRSPWPRATVLRLGAAAALTATVVLAPFLAAIVRSARAGEFVSPDILWRSSPPGVDVLAFLMPNPNHPLLGANAALWLRRLRADGFEENTAALGLVVLATLGYAAWRRVPLPGRWLFLGATFLLLSLGPFVQVGGVNTRLPTPWALLRYAPGIGLVRAPARFAVLVLIAACVLFACAAAALLRGHPRHRVALAAALGLGLLLELVAVPRPLYSAVVPHVFAQVAADPRDVTVLVLPTGVRDGTSSLGDFSAVTQFQQSTHGKALVGGGYLSRVPASRVAALRAEPVLDLFLDLSARKPVATERIRAARQSADEFIRKARLGYVVVDRDRVDETTRRLLFSVLHVRKIGADGAFDLCVVGPRD